MDLCMRLPVVVAVLERHGLKMPALLTTVR
jgi:hypothetical protein